jgi:ribosomal protein S18 acetylase RimI-like enzyme
MALAEPEVIACPPEERVAALGVLYRRVSPALRPRLIADAVEEAEAGTIDLSGLWIARRRGRVVGTLLTQTLAGRAAAVWAPEVEGAWRRGATAASLVQAALADLAARGFLVAQALVEESAPRHAAADLAAGGLPCVTELLYLERGTALPLAVSPGVPPVDWRGFGPETEADFRAVLQGTYAGSLDMPELEGVRSLDDILASHRAGGRFSPERWQVGHVRGEPGAAAVLLLSELHDRDAWEVAYLGLTPPARGRGLGRAVLAHALELAAPHAGRIELAVDLRNTPAHRLYRSAGMTPFDRRAVHLAMLQTPGGHAAGPAPPLPPSSRAGG